MGIGELILLIVIGAIVGALGRLFHPGTDSMGILITIVIGVASMIIAGLIFDGILQFIVGVIVAVVLVALWSRMVEPRRTRTV
jgi:uncharacterized membrane protein YeaQ/YmgE (transglycosylase-associated protein family)